MKIKIIQSWSSHKILEQKINEFIQNTNIKVIEMQYKPSILAYSVMVVYEDIN